MHSSKVNDGVITTLKHEIKETYISQNSITCTHCDTRARNSVGANLAQASVPIAVGDPAPVEDASVNHFIGICFLENNLI
jgi:hypothetical protein